MEFLVKLDALKGKDKEALSRFNEMLATKRHLGKGCLFFKDKANRQRPPMYKDKGLLIESTNLCTEIMLHSSLEYTFSCIIASLNLLHWDKIKLTDAVFVSLIFLDCLCSEFIRVSEGIVGLESVREFTRKGRPVALSAMGFHTYLQSLLAGDATQVHRQQCLACPALACCKGGCKLVSDIAREDTYCRLKQAVITPVIQAFEDYGSQLTGDAYE